MAADDTPGAEAPDLGPGTERRRRRRVVIGVAALVLVGGLATVVVWRQRRSGSEAKPPPIPQPNGYDDVLVAARALKEVMPVRNGNLPDYAKFETPALKDFVAAIRGPLAQIRQGLERPFQVPYVYDLSAFTHTTMRDVGECRIFANRALQAEGVLARREMRTADEARSALDLLRLGNSLGREVPMMGYLSSLPSASLGASALRDMRDRLVDDPDLCRKTIAELARLDRERPPVARAVARESAFIDINVRSHGPFAATMLRVSGVVAKQRNQALASLRDAATRSEAFQRLVLADLAVRLHQKEHQGTPPASLPALVPAILPRLPIDPFTGQPLIYRAVEKGFELYSTGPDRDDDHLKPILKQFRRKSGDGDVTLESF